jgi:hypothetical protein
MEKAYIILAHKEPDQLYRLIEKLDDKSSDFFVHIDKKINLSVFNNLIDFKDKVHIIKREKSNWGEIGIVKAILSAFEAIKRTGKRFEQIILLSGQDYPIKSNDYLNDFFNTSPHKVFMEHWPIPNYRIWKESGGIFRINKYFIGLKPYQRFLSKTLNFTAMFLPFFRRKLPYNLKPYGGWMWWSIDMYTLDYILQFLIDHPKYLKYHKFTFVPDEMFFQTILLNSKDENLLKRITNDNKRYIHWKEGKSHPEILGRADVKNIKQSNHLFARKFDIKHDRDILEIIDQHCLA